MKYSDKIIAELCRALGSVVNEHADLELLFLEHGLSYDQFGGGIRPRSNALISALRQTSNADEALTSVVKFVLERHRPDWKPTERLLHALRLDGFVWDDGQLVPTTAEPAELGKELSQLERDLQDLRLNVAAEHYRQAHESFVAANRP